MHHTTGRFRTAIAMLVIAVVSAAIYWPGLNGNFFFDDYVNIVDNPTLIIRSWSYPDIVSAIFSSPAGPLKRPISAFSFALNHYLSGFDPFAFKLANLIIHLANGLLVGVLAGQLMRAYRVCLAQSESNERDYWIAFASALLWVVHPLNLTSVLYVVQRMTSLSSLFVLCGLIAFVSARLRLMAGRTGFLRLTLGCLGFGTLAVLTKETGALLPLYMLAVELALFRFRAADRVGRRGVVAFFLIFLFIPVAAILGKVVVNPDWITGAYSGRAFSLSERLMTEARVGWIYLRQIVLPDITQMGLYHDDLALSRGLLEPPGTVAAILGHLVLWLIAVLARRRAPFVALAVLWFYLGHSLESTVFALEIMHEHRNYLPMFGIVLAICYYASSLRVLPHHARLKALVGIAVIGVCAMTTSVRAVQFGDFFGFPLAEAAKHPQSARSNYEAGRVLLILSMREPSNLQRYAEQAQQFLRQAAIADANDLDAPMGLLRLHAMMGTTPPADLVEEIERRLRDAPPPNGIGITFRSLYRFLESGDSNLERRNIEGIFQAALINRRLHGEKRAHVLTSYGLTCLNIFGEPERATSMLVAAIEAAPKNPEFHVVLAAMQIATGQIEDARRRLDAAEAVDLFGHMAEDIQGQRHALASR